MNSPQGAKDREGHAEDVQLGGETPLAQGNWRMFYTFSGRNAPGFYLVNGRRCRHFYLEEEKEKKRGIKDMVR